MLERRNLEVIYLSFSYVFFSMITVITMKKENVQKYERVLNLIKLKFSITIKICILTYDLM